MHTLKDRSRRFVALENGVHCKAGDEECLWPMCFCRDAAPEPKYTGMAIFVLACIILVLGVMVGWMVRMHS